MIRNIFYFIKYHFYKLIIRKYRISAIKSYGFYINDYLVDNKNDMDRLFNKYGSDKGGKKNKYLGWNPHNYGQIYDDLFYHLQLRKFNLLEVGIGSVDKNIKSLPASVINILGNIYIYILIYIYIYHVY